MRVGFGAILGLGATGLAATAARAAQPAPWETGYQPAATPLMDSVTGFYDILFVIITAITIFVLVLLVYVMWRFSEKRNPTPSRTTHNTLVEVLWTVIPVVILVVIAIPSFKLLYYSDTIPKGDLTLKVVGHQWYWSYQYPDNGGFGFDSVIVPDSDLKPGQPRLLTVDNRVVVPVGKTIRVQVTADDVIHSWAVPSFGFKIDAVPGRLNETWFKVERPGIYYGQCSELCGVNHGFMPIEIQAVTQKEFDDWVVKAKKQFAGTGTGGEAERKVAEIATETR